MSLAAAVLAVSCASAPIQEMSDARQAIGAARAVIDESAPATSRHGVQRAVVLLERAEGHLRAGEYAAARENAEAAKSLAIEARERAAGEQ